MASIGWRSLLVFGHDLIVISVAWLTAFWLRFNLDIPHSYFALALRSLVWVIPLQALIFWRFGLYRGIWRFASLPDLRRIIYAVAVAAVAVPTALFMVERHLWVPRSVLIINPGLLVMLMGGSRLAYRAWKERSLTSLIPGEREPVFVLGAGETAVNLIKELAHSAKWRVIKEPQS